MAAAMARKGKQGVAKRRRKWNRRQERMRVEEQPQSPVTIRFVDPAELRRQSTR
jgi:hypothetical protein